jgi:hypothetical protein
MKTWIVPWSLETQSFVAALLKFILLTIENRFFIQTHSIVFKITKEVPEYVGLISATSQFMQQKATFSVKHAYQCALSRRSGQFGAIITHGHATNGSLMSHNLNWGFFCVCQVDYANISDFATQICQIWIRRMRTQAAKAVRICVCFKYVQILRCLTEREHFDHFFEDYSDSVVNRKKITNVFPFYMRV